MTHTPEFFTVPVRDGGMTVARWGHGARLLLGIHGLTASSMMYAPIGRRLGPEYTLIAPDLRGRGASAGLPGPYGMRSHATDCAAVIRAAGEHATVIGASMGGFVADVLAAEHPDLVERVLLVDGGLPLDIPPGVDPKALAETMLGPSLQRLQMTFPSVDAYFDLWRVHPAVGEDWNEDVEAYLRHDLTATGAGFRSRVNADAVRADLDDQIADPHSITESLPKITCSVHLLQAPRNIMNEPAPLQPDSLVAKWRETVPQLTCEMVDDVNHYTIVFGERGTNTILRRIAEPVPAT